MWVLASRTRGIVNLQLSSTVAVRIFSAIAEKLRTETCNTNLMQYYLEMELVNFGLVALLSSYGMICSPQWLLPVIQSPTKYKSPTAGCLST